MDQAPEKLEAPSFAAFIPGVGASSWGSGAY